jgi:hypothetical protein
MRKWEDNIGIDAEIRWKSVNWFHLAQVRDQWRDVVNTIITLWVP